MADIVKELGLLALGTRLKRMGDRLQMDTQRLLDREGIAVQASQCPLLVALERAGPMTVGALVGSLGVSQPGVTRAVRKLSEQGLVAFRQCKEDGRQRIVALTQEGRDVLTRCHEHLWPAIELAVASLCAPTGSLLEHLARMEAALDAASLEERASRGVET